MLLVFYAVYLWKGILFNHTPEKDNRITPGGYEPERLAILYDLQQRYGQRSVLTRRDTRDERNGKVTLEGRMKGNVSPKKLRHG